MGASEEGWFVEMGRELRHELECVASCELGYVLDASVWDAGMREHLARYLTSELGAYGMLSVEKARECGQSLGTERRQARALLARLERVS